MLTASPTAAKGHVHTSLRASTALRIALITLTVMLTRCTKSEPLQAVQETFNTLTYGKLLSVGPNCQEQ